MNDHTEYVELDIFECTNTQTGAKEYMVCVGDQTYITPQDPRQTDPKVIVADLRRLSRLVPHALSRVFGSDSSQVLVSDSQAPDSQAVVVALAPEHEQERNMLELDTHQAHAEEQEGNELATHQANGKAQANDVSNLALLFDQSVALNEITGSPTGPPTGSPTSNASPDTLQLSPQESSTETTSATNGGVRRRSTRAQTRQAHAQTLALLKPQTRQAHAQTYGPAQTRPTETRPTRPTRRSTRLRRQTRQYQKEHY